MRLILMLLALAFAAAPAAAEPRVIREGLANMTGTYEYILRSEITGQDYLVQVAEPVRPVGRGQKAPVVFVLDGNYFFGMATDVARNLQIVREIGPAWIVAVGFPGEGLGPWIDGRNRDYVHVVQEDGGRRTGGGGEGFQRFLTEELRPFLASNPYMDLDHTVLYGHSASGLFTARVLSTHPEAFDGYLIGSPAVFVEPAIMDRIAAWPGGAQRPRVFLGYAGGDMEARILADMPRLTQALEAGDRYDLQVRAFPDQTHVSVEGVLFANGLKFLLPPPAP
ncbi:alpha/beta hydrolase-fold protein [Brevundimonas sp. 2R-24]|uniref:Alpha/beta hydrolase-fold protein n=1 Tax=Peiella sedimenti TaxID=3061083 RepID=A0ABT8SL00_9CAUL|nr:alpha/beta hydrolase-fold protein [Caulobacteraceae bacterium XZ-24]